jgi:hypothetical protein
MVKLPHLGVSIGSHRSVGFGALSPPRLSYLAAISSRQCLRIAHRHSEPKSPQRGPQRNGAPSPRRNIYTGPILDAGRSSRSHRIW